MSVILLTNDLMFGSQVTQAAAAAGVALQVVGHADAVIDALRDREPAQGIRAVIVDLTVQGALTDLSPRLAALSNLSLRLIAVGPHVHKAKLETARRAGWQVYTRGQFHADATTILAEPVTPQ